MAYYDVIYVTVSTRPPKIMDCFNSFIIYLFNKYFRFKNMYLNKNLKAITKVLTACFYHQISKRFINTFYDTIPKKTLSKMESLHFKIVHAILNVCLKYHKSEYFIDKKGDGDIKRSFWCKNSILLFDWKYVT